MNPPPLATFIIGTSLLFCYFIPAFYAWKRHHRNREAIFLLDLFLGWTVLGWIIAAIWSATDNIEAIP